MKFEIITSDIFENDEPQCFAIDHTRGNMKFADLVLIPVFRVNHTQDDDYTWFRKPYSDEDENTGYLPTTSIKYVSRGEVSDETPFHKGK